MRTYQRLTRPTLVVFAASASFYMGAQWLQGAPGAPPLALAIVRPPGAPARTGAPQEPEHAPGAERDPTLLAPSRQQVVPASGGDAFAPVSWVPPPPKAPPPAPALPEPVAAPTAPPLPFTFVGLLEQGLGIAQPKAFLARGETLLVVSAGDTVETNYSVDAITAQQITLTYLPLKTRQTLAVAGGVR